MTNDEMDRRHYLELVDVVHGHTLSPKRLIELHKHERNHVQWENSIQWNHEETETQG
jgi:hypothetical protein